MPVLEVHEYNKSYFDGRESTYAHNAGYSRYARWPRFDGEDSLGEYWKDKAKQLFDKYKLKGKKVLEIGCAKGFVVKDLRDMGVNAFGLDVSLYALGEAESEVKQYLTVGDARTYLSNYKTDEFDVVFSLRFLECISEADLPALIDEINRISKFQFHIVDETSNKFYLEKTLEWWQNLNWTIGTSLLNNKGAKRVLTKE